MKQLSLDVHLSDYAVFDSFLPGPNAELLHALREAARMSPRAVIWIWGPAESGRTHLLQACVNDADAAGSRSAYLPLGTAELPPAAVEGMGEMDLVCLDNVHEVAGDALWERGLFQIFERLKERGARLILTADRPPLQLAFGLPDLTSRFTSGAIFRLIALSDEEKLRAMQLRAQWRGLELPDETARYMLTRVDRRAGALFDLLDKLDRQALAAQKKLTVPFVKSVLDATAVPKT
jgi:DnaA family protein